MRLCRDVQSLTVVHGLHQRRLRDCVPLTTPKPFVLPPAVRAKRGGPRLEVIS
jgi:hypothetical protein